MLQVWDGTNTRCHASLNLLSPTCDTKPPNWSSAHVHQQTAHESSLKFPSCVTIEWILLTFSHRDTRIISFIFATKSQSAVSGPLYWRMNVVKLDKMVFSPGLNGFSITESNTSFRSCRKPARSIVTLHSSYSQSITPWLLSRRGSFNPKSAKQAHKKTSNPIY